MVQLKVKALLQVDHGLMNVELLLLYGSVLEGTETQSKIYIKLRKQRRIYINFNFLTTQDFMIDLGFFKFSENRTMRKTEHPRHFR